MTRKGTKELFKVLGISVINNHYLKLSMHSIIYSTHFKSFPLLGQMSIPGRYFNVDYRSMR